MKNSTSKNTEIVKNLVIGFISIFAIFYIHFLFSYLSSGNISNILDFLKTLLLFAIIPFPIIFLAIKLIDNQTTKKITQIVYKFINSVAIIIAALYIYTLAYYWINYDYEMFSLSTTPLIILLALVIFLVSRISNKVIKSISTFINIIAITILGLNIYTLIYYWLAQNNVPSPWMFFQIILIGLVTLLINKTSSNKIKKISIWIIYNIFYLGYLGLFLTIYIVFNFRSNGCPFIIRDIILQNYPGRCSAILLSFLFGVGIYKISYKFAGYLNFKDRTKFIIAFIYLLLTISIFSSIVLAV